MTKKEFIFQNEHEIMGMIVDAHVLNLEGAFRSRRLQELLQKVRIRLGEMYDQAQAPGTNGQLKDGPLGMMRHENH